MTITKWKLSFFLAIGWKSDWNRFTCTSLISVSNQSSSRSQNVFLPGVELSMILQRPVEYCLQCKNHFEPNFCLLFIHGWQSSKSCNWSTIRSDCNPIEIEIYSRAALSTDVLRNPRNFKLAYALPVLEINLLPGCSKTFQTRFQNKLALFRIVLQFLTCPIDLYMAFSRFHNLTFPKLCFLRLSKVDFMWSKKIHLFIAKQLRLFANASWICFQKYRFSRLRRYCKGKVDLKWIKITESQSPVFFS